MSMTRLRAPTPTTQGAPGKEAVRVSATRDKTAPSPAYTHDKHAHKLGRIFCRHISGSFDSASVNLGLLGVALLTFPQMDYLEKLKTFFLVSVSPSCFGKQPSLTRLSVDVVRARILVLKRV